MSEWEYKVCKLKEDRGLSYTQNHVPNQIYHQTKKADETCHEKIIILKKVKKKNRVPSWIFFFT